MKAVVCTRYGPPEVLQLKEIAKPSPRDHELLIRVKTTAVNTADWRIRKADPPVIRLFFGFFRPRVKILGGVVSGEIESAGKKVKRFKTGDQVFGSTGWKMGANAEFVCLPEKAVLAILPPEISHEEAAAFPFGSFTALHYLKKAGIRTGQKVMIYGASGATGTAAVQLAAYFGAEVTGVCSAGNTGLVRSIGATHVIDYRTEDFTEKEKYYDIIFDAVGKTSYSTCRKALAPGGKYVTVNKGLARSKQESLEWLTGIVASGKLKAVIDRIYPLEELPEAHRYAETGHKKGNVVIRVRE